MKHKITFREKDGSIQAIVGYKYDNSVEWKYKSKQGFKKKSDAQRWASSMTIELAQSEGRIALDENMTMGDAVELFLAHKKRTVKTNTFLSYASVCQYYKAYSNLSLHKLTPLKVDEIISTIPPSMGIPAKSFWLFLEKKKLINKFDIDFQKYKTQRKGKVISSDDYNKILELCQKNLQYLVFCKIAYRFGMRAGEILGLTPDVVFKDKIIVKQQWVNISTDSNGKTIRGLSELKNKENGIRELPSTPDILSLLHSLPFNFREGRFFSISYHTGINQTIKHLGYHAHDFRHTRASEMVNSGFNLRYIAYFLGDTLDTVIKNYVSLNDDMLQEQNKKFLSFFCRS